MRALLATAVCAIGVAAAAQNRIETSPGVVSGKLGAGPAAILADGYLYVSGQGPRRSDGSMPANFAEQVRQSLDNVKSVVESAGLTMRHVVYIQVYLENTTSYTELRKVFADYFPADAPARAVLGVARVPESPLQITAVAVQNLTGKQVVTSGQEKTERGYSPAVLTHDRLFVSTIDGRDVSTGLVPEDPAVQVKAALERLRGIVESAGLSLANMVFVNPYLTREIPMRVMNEEYAKHFEFGNTPARATIMVTSLPGGARIAYTGVAVRDLSRRRAVRPKNMLPSPTASPCVFAGDTLYCSAKSGFIPGPNAGVYAATISHQLRQSVRNQLDNLEEVNMRLDQVVFTTLYLDDLSDLPIFEKVYREYFQSNFPARMTVQQIAPRDRKPNEEEQYPELEQFSLIAVRTRQKR
jgi:enamine deaminase RidA (YjgF/YER057c/UK114 family)